MAHNQNQTVPGQGSDDDTEMTDAPPGRRAPAPGNQAPDLPGSTSTTSAANTASGSPASSQRESFSSMEDSTSALSSAQPPASPSPAPPVDPEVKDRQYKSLEAGRRWSLKNDELAGKLKAPPADDEPPKDIPLVSPPVFGRQSYSEQERIIAKESQRQIGDWSYQQQFGIIIHGGGYLVTDEVIFDKWVQEQSAEVKRPDVLTGEVNYRITCLGEQKGASFPSNLTPTEIGIDVNDGTQTYRVVDPNLFGNFLKKQDDSRPRATTGEGCPPIVIGNRGSLHCEQEGHRDPDFKEVLLLPSICGDTSTNRYAVSFNGVKALQTAREALKESWDDPIVRWRRGRGYRFTYMSTRTLRLALEPEPEPAVPERQSGTMEDDEDSATTEHVEYAEPPPTEKLSKSRRGL